MSSELNISHRGKSTSISCLDQFEKPRVSVARKWFYNAILPRRRRILKSRRQRQALQSAVSSKPHEISRSITFEDATTYRLVEKGEDPAGSELYPVWGTPLKNLSVFGIGIVLYFRTLLQFAVLMFVLAFVSSPSIIYFLSSEYSGDITQRKIDIRLYGTAVCTHQDDEGSRLKRCPWSMTQLYVDLAVLILICTFVLIMHIVQTQAQTYIDEQEQTPGDYTVVVSDPDKDAWDPDEWEMFFSQFGPVKFVTVTVNNRVLLEAIARKRYYENMLRMEAAAKSVSNSQLSITELMNSSKTHRSSFLQSLLCCSVWRHLAQKLTLYRDMTYWQEELRRQCIEIKNILSSNKSFRVTSVFVMFETEQAQRMCLSETTAGICATMWNSPLSSVPNRVRFRGRNILEINIPVEPSAVKWKFVGVSRLRRFVQQSGSVLIICVLMILVYILIKALKDKFIGDDDESLSVARRRHQVYILAYALAATDYLGCLILYYTHGLEQHQTREGEQISLLNKLVVFRVFNGILVLFHVMNFTDTLSEYNLLQLQAVFIANATVTPFLQLLSLGNRLQQWILGPIATSQKQLNQYYSGTHWQIAERYTEITKVIGTALFYHPVLPTGLVITAVSLVINYWVDKYCLLRKWKVPPKYNGQLAKASHYHLLLVVFLSFVTMTRWYDGWPYDFATKRSIAKAVRIDLIHTKAQGFVPSLMIKLFRIVFPPPRQYDSVEQTDMMEVLCYIVMVVILTVAIFLMMRFAMKWWIKYISGRSLAHRQKTRTRMTSIPCSYVKRMTAYIPTYRSDVDGECDFPYFSVPLNYIEPRYLPWKGDHQAYCLVDDIINDPDLYKYLIGTDSEINKSHIVERIFGSCRQYNDKPAVSLTLQQLEQRTREESECVIDEEFITTDQQTVRYAVTAGKVRSRPRITYA